MKKTIFKIASMICLGLIATKGNAQDTHFSQFYESAILRNPALTGIFTEDYKIGIQYRNQWASISKPFKTFQGNLEMRFPMGNEVNDYLSIGLLGFSDVAGQTNFKTSAFYPAINYNKSLEDRHSSYLSFGFTAGYVQRSIDLSKMTFDNQYQNGYSPDNASGEQMPNPKIMHFDLGAGVSFNSSFGTDNKHSYFVGVSAYHFTKPKQSFYNNETVVLNTRWNVNGGLSLTFDDAWSGIFHGNYMLQGAYQEIMAGGLIRWSRFNNLNRRDFAFAGGVFYRVKDAIVPTIKLEYKHQTVTASYDVNTSSLKEVSKMRGGFEISIFSTGFFNSSAEDKHMCIRF